MAERNRPHTETQKPVAADPTSTKTGSGTTPLVEPTSDPPSTALTATRREVLRSGVAAAAMATLISNGAARALMGAGRAPTARGKRTEMRDLLFDFSFIDTREHDLILVAGTRRHTLKPPPPGTLARLRKRHPVLNRVPNSRATHWVRARFPAEGLQLCYVQRVRRRSRVEGKQRDPDPWDMASIFYHTPRSALLDGFERVKGQLGAGELPPVPQKWAALAVGAGDLSDLDDPVGLDAFKDCNDTACALVASHPETFCADACAHSYIQQQIIGPSPQTSQLGQWFETAGCIEPQQNWSACGDPIVQNTTGPGTNVPLCNPDTGEQAVNSSNQLQYQPLYSQDTNDFLSQAISPALQQIKADTTLGANVSANPDPTEGLIYRYQDGTPTSDQTDGLGLGSGLSYDTKNLSPAHGYSVKVTDVQASTASNVSVDATLEVENWFVRFLGLYVRYLDANDNPIATVDLSDGGASVLAASTMQGCCSDSNTEYDTFMDLLGPEFEILGIPVSKATKTLTIPVPDNATSFQLLASGLGNTPLNSNPFSATVIPGTSMTALFDLLLPVAFLALNAAAGLAPMTDQLRNPTTLASLMPFVLEAIADVAGEAGYDDPAVFADLGVKMCQTLLKASADPLQEFIVDFLNLGETTEDLEDTFPLVGMIISAIYAFGAVAALAQTSADVATSPSTYDFKVTLTHDVAVTISHDPNDAAGWPATATHYTVVLQFDDGGTPTKLDADLPAGTVTDPQTVTFTGVPLGGKVTASVQVYSASEFEVGHASDGPFDNLDPSGGGTLNLPLTLVEVLVPITATTVYSHEEVMELDSDGNHVWNPTTTPPVQAAPGCNPAQGQLCQVTGITINTTAGAMGQSWQSYNAAVANCSGGSASQLHQFSNLSIGQTPESGYFFSGCGFSIAPRLAYDLLNRPDFNFYLATTTPGSNFNGVIRQVRLDGTSSGFDAPDSNKAWGKLLYESDAFLLHPAGQIISVNSSIHKIELVRLPSAAVSDDMAPTSQVYGGQGLREGLMDDPTRAALAPNGTLLVLESINNRVQAFDLNANPAQKFGSSGTDYFFPLREQAVSRYLDFAVEFAGYMYVLWVDPSGVFTLDIYDPQGAWLTSTTGLNAQSMAVNYWRDVYTQNLQVLEFPNGDLPARTEPSISHWIPSTP
jgi:hypothetical protein